MVYFRFFIFSFLLLSLSACKKEMPVTLEYIYQAPGQVNDIVLDGQSIYLAYGGEYSPGGLLQSKNNAQQFDSVLTADFGCFGLYLQDSALYGGFHGSQGFMLSPQGLDYFWIAKWQAWYAIVSNPQGDRLVCGEGTLCHLPINDTTQRIDSFSRQLKAMEVINDSTVLMAGYGAVLRSKDFGKSWNNLGLSGDFFQAFAKGDNKYYVLGEFGSVFRGDRTGEQWSKLRSASTLLTKPQHHRDLAFVDDNIGFIVGEDGLLLKTENAGEDWIVLEHQYEREDFICLAIGQDGVFLGSQSGALYKIAL